MNWRTELSIKPAKKKINLTDTIFTIGSCFSDEIGLRLQENKFKVSINPFGAVYNPISIHRLLMLSLLKEFPTQESYSQNEEVHLNYHFHSSFSSLSKNELENKIQESIIRANELLRNAELILITYGTSFVYQLHHKLIVANCHKMPSSLFTKHLLTEKKIVDSFSEFYVALKSINPKAKVILTVSPVRHIHETLELNSVSKSLLRIACHSITQQLNDVEYFPSYEILMDDLRDYRFYKKDLIHPTDEAVDYIWQKWIETYFDNTTQQFIADWQKIKSDLAHKPFHPTSEKHQAFLRSVLKKLESMQSITHVDSEIAQIKLRLKS